MGVGFKIKNNIFLQLNGKLILNQYNLNLFYSKKRKF